MGRRSLLAACAHWMAPGDIASQTAAYLTGQEEGHWIHGKINHGTGQRKPTSEEGHSTCHTPGKSWGIMRQQVHLGVTREAGKAALALKAHPQPLSPAHQSLCGRRTGKIIPAPGGGGGGLFPLYSLPHRLQQDWETHPTHPTHLQTGRAGRREGLPRRRWASGMGEDLRTSEDGRKNGGTAATSSTLPLHTAFGGAGATRRLLLAKQKCVSA